MREWASKCSGVQLAGAAQGGDRIGRAAELGEDFAPLQVCVRVVGFLRQHAVEVVEGDLPLAAYRGEHAFDVQDTRVFAMAFGEGPQLVLRDLNLTAVDQGHDAGDRVADFMGTKALGFLEGVGCFEDLTLAALDFAQGVPRFGARRVDLDGLGRRESRSIEVSRGELSAGQTDPGLVPEGERLRELRECLDRWSNVVVGWQLSRRDQRPALPHVGLEEVFG